MYIAKIKVTTVSVLYFSCIPCFFLVSILSTHWCNIEFVPSIIWLFLCHCCLRGIVLWYYQYDAVRVPMFLKGVYDCARSIALCSRFSRIISSRCLTVLCGNLFILLYLEYYLIKEIDSMVNYMKNPISHTI